MKLVYTDDHLFIFRFVWLSRFPIINRTTRLSFNKTLRRFNNLLLQEKKCEKEQGSLVCRHKGKFLTSLKLIAKIFLTDNWKIAKNPLFKFTHFLSFNFSSTMWLTSNLISNHYYGLHFVLLSKLSIILFLCSIF